MRLKLPGGERSKGSGVLCAGAHNYRSITDALAGESPAAYARSLGVAARA